MENEPPNTATPCSSSSRPVNPSGPAYSGIPDRQTVQVIQQALTRQPNTAAQYLQQMYAAQQQHLMLQTAALQQQQQQQHLNSTQLQNLAAAQQAQQASLAASRAPPAVSSSQQNPSQPLTISLTTSPQIIQRPQTVSSAPPPSSGITQQAVLLGNASSPALSTNQAQMYLRAQMLIFTPTATVSNIPSEVSPGSTTQVQNFAVRGGGTTQSQFPSLAMKPATATINPHPVTTAAQTKTTQSATSAESQSVDSRVTASKTLVPVTAHPLITQACSPQLVQPQKPLHIQPRPILPLTQVSSSAQYLGSPPITSLAALEPPSTCAETNGHRQSPSLCASLAGHEVTVARKLVPVTSAVILQIPAALGSTPPTATNVYKHYSSISPTLVKAPVHAAAVSINRAPDRYQAHDSAYTGVPASDSCPPLDMTSGNGSSPIPAAATGNTHQNGENKPPQAVVKPQILTHVIEGFVIQEGGQPFPSSHRSRAVLEVGRSSLLVGPQEKHQQVPLPEKVPQQETNTTTTTTDSEMEETFVAASKEEGDPPKLKCELCGRVDFEYKFKRSKRFCSMACAKRYNVGCTKRVGLFHPDRSKLQKPAGAKHSWRRSRKGNLQSPGTESTMQISEPITPISITPQTTTSNLKHSNSQEDSSRYSDNSSYEEPLSPMSASSSLSRQRRNDRGLELTDLHRGDLISVNHNFLPSDPAKWNVEDVYEFIRSLPGCQEISEEFRAQEIDGQALLLLKEDHLMSTMNIKLGPALKLYARISMLKDS
ncbi:polyhomeotic-like protein 2 isoform X2 [Bufo bufo]|uniref:polyhomeotic-like protein 2 isoform X2 n=1 Tax=Bufo bufo TaxID=8384 RepID=UPI001ABDBCFA|nr:polyhomeotic-like protein 2 isoform X2 [Bufo bufo]